ncbi:uncharacterized protein LOC142635252 [Castanea sativa]|uniref:uncharacterized protein LOC142635252 n=1 Tax=Castanea sativa TaxID=21020 RepID=UPI003F64F324
MASDSTSEPSSSSAPFISVVMADESANNPFFLPTNENPGLILTSQPLTGPENYMTWARSVFLALSSRNKFGFVNGSVLEPDPTTPLFNSWNRCNTTILSWLTNSLSPDLKLDAQQKERVFRFPMGLNDRYGILIGQILLIEPFPSLSKVCSLVLQEEKRRNIGPTVNMVQQLDVVAMYANKNRSFQGTQGQNRGGGKGKKDRLVCTYCGFTGQIADNTIAQPKFSAQSGFGNTIAANSPFGFVHGASGGSFLQ